VPDCQIPRTSVGSKPKGKVKEGRDKLIETTPENLTFKCLGGESTKHSSLWRKRGKQPNFKSPQTKKTYVFRVAKQTYF
jgi:hypothetical protein